MKNLKLTLPRTILFGILLAGGIVYYCKNGIKTMETYEIVLSAVLMLALLTLIILKILGAVRKGA